MPLEILKHFHSDMSKNLIYYSQMIKLKNLEKKIKNIEERNKRVELDRRWETS